MKRGIAQRVHCVLFLYLTTRAIAAASFEESTSGSAILEEAPLNKGAGLGDTVYLSLSTNGQNGVLFVVDTGFDHTILDESVVAELGKPLGTTDFTDEVGGKKSIVSKYKMPDLFWGKTKLRTEDTVAVFDLSFVQQSLGRPVKGILGMDCLQRYALQLDFDARKIRLLRSPLLNVETLGKRFFLKLSETGHYFARENLLGAGDISTEIDTGCNSTGTLESALFGKAITEHKASVSANLIMSASGVNQKREGRIPKCEFGGEFYRDLILGEDSVNRMGLGFLALHLVTLDFPIGTMYLKRRAGDFPKDESKMSGLSVLRKVDTTFVYSVEKDGPADRAGIQPNDVILKVNDHAANALELWELRNMLQSGDGKEVRLTIERNGEKIQIPVTLKRKI